MSLPGLPPLPKSLSGLELNNGHNTNNNTGIIPIDIQRISTPSIDRKPSTLDTQLAILRREMVSTFIQHMQYIYLKAILFLHVNI